MRKPVLSGLFLLLVLVVARVPDAYAEKIRITTRTLGEFTALKSGTPALACHRSTRVGTLSKTKLVTGAVWTLYDGSKTTGRLTAIENRLKKKKKKLSSSQRKALLKEKKALTQLASAVSRVGERCRSRTSPPIPGDGEFRGDAQTLTPYRERLTEREVQHLLDRVAFGGDARLRAIGLEQGLTPLVNALVDGVLSDGERSAAESRADYWANRASWYESDDLRGKRVWTAQAVEIGQMYRLIYSAEPFREWMTLLLAGHFAVNLDRIGFSYNTYAHQGLPMHVELLRSHALGSIERLSKAMLTDRAMNEWLDNKNNRIGEPNQNFARELLELFLLGELDPVTGQRNYGEDSVVAATAFVSGYYENEEMDPVNRNLIMTVLYDPDQHDTQAYAVFAGIAGAEQRRSFMPEDFVSHVLYGHHGSARYLAERIAGQILYPGLPEQVVAGLASDLRAGRYELKPFLKKVLKSSALFSGAARGVCIDTPLDSFIRLARNLFPQQQPGAGDDRENPFFYSFWAVMEAASDAGQQLFEPTSVFGWKGSCNINRSGEVSRGEGWSSMQRVLGRMRGCGDIMDRLNWFELDFPQQLGLTARMGAYEIVEQVRKVFGVRQLSDQERALLAQFLVTELDDNGRRYTRTVDLNQSWFVRRKIPRLVCMLNELSSSQVR